MALIAIGGRWRLVDRMLSVYGVVIALLAATHLGQPGIAMVVAAHLAIPALVWLAANAPPSPASRVLRGLYPVALLTGLYSAIDVVNQFGARPTWDRQIQLLEHAMFGMQPSRDWWRTHPSAFWSTILHTAYLSYYLVVTAPIVFFLVRRQSEALERYLNGLIATYLICYVCYYLIPVSGPYYEFPRPSGAFIANWPAQLVYSTLRGGSAFGAAFPSSHVAATVAATIGAWQGSRRLGMILLIPTLLLAVGVVYCQMHYVTDSVAGLLVGSIVAGSVTMGHWNRQSRATIPAV